MDNDVAKIYDKLMEISTDLGGIKSDIESVKKDIQTNYISSEEADRNADTKLEKYYQQAKERQDSIRDSLIKVIADNDAKFQTVLEEDRRRISELEHWRADTEGRTSKAIIKWLEKARDYIIWAAILALIAYGFKYVTELTNLLHMPPVAIEPKL